MKNWKFADFKANFIEICKKNNACKPEFAKVLVAETAESLLEIVISNIHWCYKNEIATAEMLDFFGEEMCWERGLLYRGERSVTNPAFAIFTLGSSQATVETLGSSQATVETWDSSQATVKTLDSSLCRNLTTKKITLKKGDFEIEIIE